MRYDWCHLLFFVFFIVGCSKEVNVVLDDMACELPEAVRQLPDTYLAPEDSLKKKAAMYLLEALPRQWHYDMSLYDSTGIQNRVWDIDVIDVDYLRENIEYAFKAWNLPWCRNLTFEEFCHWILPYKMADEEPVRWRRELWEEYSWIFDVYSAEDNAETICRLINDSVNEWFTINWDNPYRLDVNYFKAKQLGEGSCYEASMMILYPLRAVGVPAVFDGVPRWVNRSGAHFWNAVYNNGSICTFNGPDRNPGVHKVQFVGVGRMLFKMPKVWRRDYKEGRIDVTSEYIPVCDVKIDGISRKFKSVSLASFDNSNWRVVASASVKCGRAIFKDMARDVVYLPVSEAIDGYSKVISYPILINEDGGFRSLKPDRFHTEHVRLTAKYPEDESNLIVSGLKYELFYWDGRWKSLGRKVAQDDFIEYDKVPKNALLWLRNLDGGVQERIFVYQEDKQVWY